MSQKHFSSKIVLSIMNPKKTILDSKGFTIKFHANGKTVWSKGKIVDGNPEGYWEWYRLDGTLKRSGFSKQEFLMGNG